MTDYTGLTNEQLNILVTERVMELQRVEPESDYFWPSVEMVQKIKERYPDVMAVDYFPAPPYSTSIAAAYQMEAEIERRGLHDIYAKNLRMLIAETRREYHGENWEYVGSDWLLIHATPRQRCEAALAALPHELDLIEPMWEPTP